MFGLLSGSAYSQGPDQFESLLASAQQAQAGSDFEAAAGFYRQAIAFHPEIAEIRANLGLMYYQTGRDEQAADAFRQAIRLNPSLFVPNLFLGLDYVKLKRSLEAIPYLKKAAVLRPTDAQAQLGLGQAYAGTANTRLAIRSYLRAVELDPGNADTWYRLGVSYLEQVEADARVLLTRHKDSAYLQALMADNFSEQHAFVQAAEAFKKAAAAAALPPGTHASYGLVLLRQHDLPGAELELNAELKSNPGSIIAKLGLARLHVEQDAPEQAAKEVAKIWKADAGFVRVNGPQLTAGLAQPRRSALQSALETAQAAGDLPEEAVALFRNDFAEKPASQGSISGAKTASSEKEATRNPAELYAGGKYRKCADLLASRPQQLQVSELRMLTSCAYSTGDYRHAFDAGAKLAMVSRTEVEGLYWETKAAQKLAIHALSRASEIDSNSPKMHVLLGDLYRQRKYFPDAEQEYRKALALKPEDTGALFGLSLALLADNQLDDAFQVAQAALKNNSDDPELNAVMGEILCAHDDFSGAEPFLKKSLNTKPEYVAHVHALLGSVYAKTNRTQEAIAELKFALAGDKDGHIHYQIARLYLKVGDREAAKQAFEVSNRLRGENLNKSAVAMQQGEGEAEPQ